MSSAVAAVKLQHQHPSDMIDSSRLMMLVSPVDELIADSELDKSSDSISPHVDQYVAANAAQHYGDYYSNYTAKYTCLQIIITAHIYILCCTNVKKHK